MSVDAIWSLTVSTGQSYRSHLGIIRQLVSMIYPLGGAETLTAVTF